MSEEKTIPEIVDSKFLADIFGLTTRRIQQLTKEGAITSKRIKGSNKYEFLPVVKQYIKYLSDKANNREEKTGEAVEIEMRKMKAEARLKESKASMAALELDELKGEMHRSDDVEAIMTDLVFAIRSMIVALPGRLAIDVFNATSAAEASEIIKLECHNILNNLSNYRFDPDEYKRRVRERQGWKDYEEEGTEG